MGFQLIFLNLITRKINPDIFVLYGISVRVFIRRYQVYSVVVFFFFVLNFLMVSLQPTNMSSDCIFTAPASPASMSSHDTNTEAPSSSTQPSSQITDEIASGYRSVLLNKTPTYLPPKKNKRFNFVVLTIFQLVCSPTFFRCNIHL